MKKNVLIRNFVWGPIFFSLCLNIGVRSCCADEVVAKAFFSKPLQEQIDDFGHYGFEDEYEIYMYGMRLEPPMMHLAKEFARSGSAVVSQLEQKLTEARDDYSVWSILLIYEEMSRLKTYDLVADKGLMAQLEARVNSMKSDGLKKMSRDVLRDMGNGKERT